MGLEAKDKERDKEPVEGNWYVLVHGLTVGNSPILLVPGLTLRPIEAELTVFDLAAAGAVGFRQWALLEPYVGQCKCEIVSASDGASATGFDTLNRAWLISNMLCLRGHARHVALACCCYSWNLIAGHQKRSSGQFKQQLMDDGVDAAVFSPKAGLRPFKGNLLDFHLAVQIPKTWRKDGVTQNDADWIAQHFDSFDRLACESESFRFSLIAISDWRYSKDARAAIARLWSGIEAIFGIKSELVYRLATSAASILCSRGDSRIAKFKHIKRLYSTRSKAVHGAAISEGELLDALDESYQLLRELVLTIVERGQPFTKSDIEKSVLG